MLRATLLALSLLSMLVPGLARADALDDVRVGNQAFRDGQLEAAVGAFGRAIESGQLSGDNLALAYNNRGVAFGELGDFDRSISDYQESLRLKSDDAVTLKNLRVAHTRRGQALANLGEQERALAEYELAIAIDPENATTLLRRAELYTERGELAKAQADLDLALKLQPGDAAITAQASRVAAARAAAEAAAKAAAAQNAAKAAAASSTTPAATPAGQTATPTEPARAPEPTRAAESPTTVATPSTATAAPVATGGGGKLRVLRDVHVRAEPDRQSESLGTIAAGQVYEQLGESRGWILIELRNGKRGYVYERFLEPVAE